MHFPEYIFFIAAALPLAGGDGSTLVLSQPKGVPQEYSRRAKDLDEKDLEGHLKLAQWCAEKKYYSGIRREYEHVLTLNADHEESRAAVGWKKNSEGRWEPDYVKLSGNIRVSSYRSLESQYKDDEGFKRLDRLLKDPATVQTLVRKAYERIGLIRIPGELSVTIRFSTGLEEGIQGMADRQGRGRDGAYNSSVTMNATYFIKTVAQRESTRAFERVLLHELIHAMNMRDNADWPKWLAEGMASYVGRNEDSNSIRKLRGWFSSSLPDIDQPSKDFYGRGVLFFRYVEQKHGIEKIRDFFHRIMVREEPYKQAMEKATGMNWGKLKQDEVKFSREFLADMTPPAEAPELGADLVWTEPEEAEVIVITKDSGAEKAGLKRGDLVTHIDGVPMKSPADLKPLWKKKAGDEVELTINRGGKELKLKVALDAPPIKSGSK